jgi:hypothetical protein
MNKRTVYIPKATFPLSTKGIISDLFELKHDVIIFTPEELKQLLEEYTNRIVNNATAGVKFELNGDTYEVVNEKSITSQLPEFLKEKGL